MIKCTLEKLKRFYELRIVKDSFLLFALTVFTGITNYASQIFMSRSLSIAEFGLINILFSIILICNAPANTLVTFVSQKTTQHTNSRDFLQLEDFFSRVLNTIHITFFFVLIIFFFGQNAIQSALKNEYFNLSIFLIIFVVLNYYSSVFLGYLAGNKKFFFYGLILSVVPFFKLGAVLLMFFGFLKTSHQPTIVILSMCLGAVLSFSLLFQSFLKTGLNVKFLKLNKPNFDISSSKTTLISLLLTMLSLLFISMDVLLLNLKFGNTIVGYYSGSLLFARMIYFFVSSLVTVLVPNLALYKNNSVEQITMLNKSLLATGLLTVALLLPINVVPTFFINLFLGASFNNSVQFLNPASLFALITSILTILMNFAFVTKQMTFITLTLLLSLVMAYLIFLFADLTAPQLIYCLAIIGIFLCVINYCFFQYKKFISTNAVSC